MSGVSRVTSAINWFVLLFARKKLCNCSLTLCPWRTKNVVRRWCSPALGLIGLICSASVEGGRTNGITCNSHLQLR